MTKKTLKNYPPYDRYTRYVTYDLREDLTSKRKDRVREKAYWISRRKMEKLLIFLVVLELIVLIFVLVIFGMGLL